MKTFSTAHFLSRELSWLAFNQRVLDEALNPANPLLERVKFFTITSSNLDEFYEVRVAGLKQQVESDIVERSVDGKTASETLRAIHKQVRKMIDQQYRCWREELLPALEKNGIHILDYEKLNDADRTWVEQYYRANVRPVLTPLGLDPSHPFPQLLNKSLNIVVQVEIEREVELERRRAVVQVPRVLPRLVRLPREDERLDFIYLGHLVGHYLADLFPGTKILGFWHFRVTRNSELYIDEEDVGNLLKAVENELHNRRRGAAVRLEADAGCPAEIYQYLLETLELTEEDLYLIDGPLNPTRLMVIYAGDHSPELLSRPPAGGVTLMVRADAGTDALRAIRGEIASIDPNLGIYNVRTLGENMELIRAFMRLALDMYGGIGVFGLILAAIGLAGVTAYAVARRRREIGIRMALGARKAQVLGLVLREGSVLVIVGTVLGFLGAMAMVRALSSLTSIFGDAFNVATTDPRLIVGAPLLLGTLAMLACYIPARRSTKIDPLQALRDE